MTRPTDGDLKQQGHPMVPGSLAAAWVLGIGGFDVGARPCADLLPPPSPKIGDARELGFMSYLGLPRLL